MGKIITERHFLIQVHTASSSFLWVPWIFSSQHILFECLL